MQRLASKPRSWVAVDLGRVVHEVVADLEGRIQQTSGHVELDGLPTLAADPTQMATRFSSSTRRRVCR